MSEVGKPQLTAAQYDSLAQAERIYHDLLPEFDKAAECGVECEREKRQAQDAYNRVRKFMATYFPHGRPDA
ncbi:MAG TPA: hypothetical protein VFH56_16345 [Acidimicrobiales bacterium]|nr:hypothetical protein [Acidimicrobiales bacterium]